MSRIAMNQIAMNQSEMNESAMNQSATNQNAASRGATNRTGRKIVMLCGYRIFPANTGGLVHSTTIARALARMGHDVLVYCLAGRREDYALAQRPAQGFLSRQIEPGLVEETNLGAAFGLLQTAFRRMDVPRIWQHELLRRGIVPRRLKRHLQDADIVVADFPFCPPVPGPWATKPWFMISHELEFRLFQQGRPGEKRFARWMEAIEAAAPARYRDIFVCAQEDHDFFRSHDAGGQLKLPYIRCGVDARMYQVAPGVREKIRADLQIADDDWVFVFSGSGYGPNLEALDALKAFCRAEAPFLASHRIFFLALGSMVRAPFRDGALIATGPVPEVPPYFAAADAGLNPITRGSGSNVKLFEYLAARLPVVSTMFGVRGTELQPDTDFLAYEPGHLRPVLESYVAMRSRDQWRQHAADVWQRHYRSCDIQELVRDALAQRPEFAI
jgi:glycosyltransferase involved in cell wall biosynthesis